MIWVARQQPAYSISHRPESARAPPRTARLAGHAPGARGDGTRLGPAPGPVRRFVGNVLRILMPISGISVLWYAYTHPDQDPLVPAKYPPELQYLAAQQTPNSEELTNWSNTHQATPKCVRDLPRPSSCAPCPCVPHHVHRMPARMHAPTPACMRLVACTHTHTCMSCRPHAAHTCLSRRGCSQRHSARPCVRGMHLHTPPLHTAVCCARPRGCSPSPSPPPAAPGRRYFQPESEAEVGAFLRVATNMRQRLRAVGSGLSPNGMGFSDEGALALGLMDKVISIDKDRMQVRGRWACVRACVWEGGRGC